MMANSQRDDSSYRHLLDEYRKRDNYDSVFRGSLGELATKFDFGWIGSCVALGPGTGDHEIAFIRRLLPNLRQLVAVEPDHDSVVAMQTNLRNAELPGTRNRFSI